MPRYGDAGVVGYEQPRRPSATANVTSTGALLGGAQLVRRSIKPNDKRMVAQANEAWAKERAKIDELVEKPPKRTIYRRSAQKAQVRQQRVIADRAGRVAAKAPASAALLRNPRRRMVRGGVGTAIAGLGALGLSRNFRRDQ